MYKDIVSRYYTFLTIEPNWPPLRSHVTLKSQSECCDIIVAKVYLLKVKIWLSLDTRNLPLGSTYQCQSWPIKLMP